MSACYYAQYTLNNGKPVATSIPATEHSVMTSWPSEVDAIRNMIRKFGGKDAVFACVMDSYDYTNALDNILPIIYKEKVEKGGLMVLRPDSGDPVSVVIQALKAADKVAGHTVNKKGFKVINGFSAIQGDGISYDEIKKILERVLGEGYSAMCVAFGMGGGLLQKVNRDTMSFATKLSFIRYANGRDQKVMKKPATESGKKSFPGILKVVRNGEGVPVIYPSDGKADPNNVLQVVYDNGPVVHFKWDDFDTVRNRVDKEWRATPRKFDPISNELQAEVDKWIKDFDAGWAQRNK
jgi:nicotinamide phosphoribosyltransferase